MRKRILLVVLCFVLAISFISPPKASAINLPQCLSDQPDGLSEFNAVTNTTELMARLIYAEARGEIEDGKKGVAQVVINRGFKNLPEFGGNNIRNVILKSPGGFAGMTTEYARCPIDTTAWTNSYNAALDPGNVTQSVGYCLWFNTNDVFTQQSKIDAAGYLVYKFPNDTVYQRVVEKVVIGGHTFFRVYGY